MRRRTPLNMWPSIADLMTVIAVPAAICAIGMYPYLSSFEVATPPVLDENQKRAAMIRQDILRVIELGEAIINEVVANTKLPRGDWQSVRFGEDLVPFRKNQTEAKLEAGKEVFLEETCRALGRYLASYEHRGDIVIFVEGHTDESTCPGEPDCNWSYSAERARRFMELMKSSAQCPGGAQLPLRTIAFAATRPVRDESGRVLQEKSRRIELSVQPDYEAIMKRHKSGNRK